MLKLKIPENFTVCNSNIPSTNSINILGIEIDNKLNFNCHIANICRQPSKETKCIKNYFEKSYKTTIYSIYISNNFYYHQTVWMFSYNNNIEKF